MDSLTHVSMVKNSKKGSDKGFVIRAAFWNYCQVTEHAAKSRATKAGVPCTIDRYFIDGLLVDQKWRCAVSGIVLESPCSGEEYSRNPFGPSLDRITPALGYVPGNVRVVCSMVNAAMNEWGLDNLLKLVAVMSKNQGVT